MKKTLIASSIAVSLVCINAQADIAVTNMFHSGTNYAANGTLLTAGGGSFSTIDDWLFHTWEISQETTFMDNTGSFAGSNAQGAWDYSAEIAGMSSNQVAVGLFSNWNGNNDMAMLEIFDCVNNICTGQGVPLANGPFVGQTFVFSGTGSGALCPGQGDMNDDCKIDLGDLILLQKAVLNPSN